MLICDEGETEEEEEVEQEEGLNTEITFHSVVGISNPKTLKMVGEVLGKKVVVMARCNTQLSFS